MFDTRIIRRLAYDGNYQRAIELIVDIIDGKKNYFEVKEDIENHIKKNNYNKIKNMTLDEMAEWLWLNAGTLYIIKTVSDFKKQDGFKDWLLSEIEECEG